MYPSFTGTVVCAVALSDPEAVGVALFDAVRAGDWGSACLPQKGSLRVGALRSTRESGLPRSGHGEKYRLFPRNVRANQPSAVGG